ncbi:MAG: hypothetical protein ABIF71_01060, partial [Planctomycetota bacterium]
MTTPAVPLTPSDSPHPAAGTEVFRRLILMAGFISAALMYGLYEPDIDIIRLYDQGREPGDGLPDGFLRQRQERRSPLLMNTQVDRQPQRLPAPGRLHPQRQDQ